MASISCCHRSACRRGAFLGRTCCQFDGICSVAAVMPRVRESKRRMRFWLSPFSNRSASAAAAWPSRVAKSRAAGCKGQRKICIRRNGCKMAVPLLGCRRCNGDLFGRSLTTRNQISCPTYRLQRLVTRVGTGDAGHFRSQGHIASKFYLRAFDPFGRSGNDQGCQVTGTTLASSTNSGRQTGSRSAMPMSVIGPNTAGANSRRASAKSHKVPMSTHGSRQAVADGGFQRR